MCGNAYPNNKINVNYLGNKKGIEHCIYKRKEETHFYPAKSSFDPEQRRQSYQNTFPGDLNPNINHIIFFVFFNRLSPREPKHQSGISYRAHCSNRRNIPKRSWSAFCRPANASLVIYAFDLRLFYYQTQSNNNNNTRTLHTRAHKYIPKAFIYTLHIREDCAFEHVIAAL